MSDTVVMAWKGGKESVLALRRLQQDPRYRVAGLLAVLDEDYGRGHPQGARHILLAGQAEALGLPLLEVTLPRYGGGPAFARVMGAALAGLRSRGVDTVAFGDLHAEDARALHERIASIAGLTPRFPVWRENPDYLSRVLIREGIRATVIGTDPEALPRALPGVPYDTAFLAGLPASADPCGENGEFHTFVHDGPDFRHPLAVMVGVRTERGGLRCADLLPVARKASPFPAQRAPIPRP